MLPLYSLWQIPRFIIFDPVDQAKRMPVRDDLLDLFYI